AGGQALWPTTAAALHASLPQAVQERTILASDWASAGFDAVLHSGAEDTLRSLQQELAQRPGPLLGLAAVHGPAAAPAALLRLLLERAVSINTTAAGGNASLMTMA